MTPKSAADDQKILAGDVVVAVRQDQVTKPSEVQRDLEDISRSKLRYAALLIQAEKGLRWVALPMAD